MVTIIAYISLIARELIQRAKQGLTSLGVASSDIENFLDIILQRLDNKPEWLLLATPILLRVNVSLNKNQPSLIIQQDNFTEMTKSYLKKQQSGRPVSEWSAY